MDWAGQVVLLFSDNWAAVCASNSGRATDPLIRGSIRELWWLCARYDVELIIRHRPGANMEVADTLSRAALSQQHHQRFLQLNPRPTAGPRLTAHSSTVPNLIS